MLEFISQNLSTIMISAVVFAVIVLDIVYLVRRKNRAKIYVNVAVVTAVVRAVRDSAENIPNIR